MITTLRTARLELAPLEPEHIPALIELWSDPNVTRYMGGPRDRATLPAAFEEDLGRNEPFDLWPVLFPLERRVVGYAGIIPKLINGRQEHELIYVFAESVWGQGLATEIAGALIEHGFRKLGLNRLVALIDPENNASAHVAKKTGFVLERTVDRDNGHQKHLYVRTLAQPEAVA